MFLLSKNHKNHLYSLHCCWLFSTITLIIAASVLNKDFLPVGLDNRQFSGEGGEERKRGKRQNIWQLEAERVVAVFILNYLTPWLWVKHRERHWEVVEAFIKCSSGPGETLVNVPIISGVVQASSSLSKWLMFNASLQCLSFNLTSGGCGSGWDSKSSHKAHKGQKNGHAVILHPLSIYLAWGELLYVSTIAV